MKVIIFFAKFFLAGSLIYWLIYSGKLDFIKTEIFWEKKNFFLFYVFPALFFCMFVQSIRWWLILKSFSISISYSLSFWLTWIGSFFNTVLPGLVSGDILKGVYLKKNIKTNWVAVYTSLLIDRIFGLLGLLFLFLISSSLFFLEEQKLFERVLTIAILCILLFSLLGIILIFPFHWQKKLKKYFPWLLNNKIFSYLINFISVLQQNKKKFIITFFLSVFIHLIITLLIYQISIILFTESLDFWKQALLIPIGLVATALPISPAGVGVGHIAFDNLYSIFQFSGGATLFNIFIISQILVFLSGFIPFIFFRKRTNI